MVYKSRKQHRKSYKRIANTRSRRGGAGCRFCGTNDNATTICNGCQYRRDLLYGMQADDGMSAYMDDYDRELMERSRTALAEAEAAYQIRRAAWMAALAEQALAEEEARSSRRSIRASSLGAHSGIKKKKTTKKSKKH
jgi:hypothetical protein